MYEGMKVFTVFSEMPVKVFECANGFLEDDLGEGCLDDVGNKQNIEKGRYI